MGAPPRTPSESILNLPIEKLPSIGPRNLTRLSRLGIKTVRNLLWHFPSRYENYSEVVPISDVEPGTKVNVRGEIVKISSRHIFPRRLTITDAVIRDTSGAIKAVWFNQSYIENHLPEGTQVSLAGRVSLGKRGIYLASPIYEKVGEASLMSADYPPSNNDSLKHTHGLVPVYPETQGVTSKYLRFLIQPLLQSLDLTDPLPDTVVNRLELMPLKQAVSAVHFPTELKDADRARERLAFDDLLLFQVKALLERRKMNQLKSTSIHFNQPLIQDVIAHLPFALTRDQKIATWEILQDLEKSYPMNRLLEGDVGSGKTVVAVLAAIQTVKAGYQAVFLAPTEVLANQHFETILPLAKLFGITIALVTSSGAWLSGVKVTKKTVHTKIANGDAAIIIGTHAVIQKDISPPRLALLIIDEQHRFGIEQRASLLHRTDVVPHLLSMTATPIPRTLALTIFGDLDISIIKEKPHDRQKTITRVVSPRDRQAAYAFMREQVKSGRQVFVICPRIESATNKGQTTSYRLTQKVTAKAPSQAKLIWADVKAVQEEYERLSEIVFPDLKIAMLHGKMKPVEKQQVMREFKNGWHDILVSTSVVEVGVDIPNATIMAIEGADRFGLAQLHQFRGRVGRDRYQSYCLLFTTDGTDHNKRLKALVTCDDGFTLAEKDMAIRGPGEFFGIKQSGIPDLTMTSLANVELIKKARHTARLILKEDATLKKYPLLSLRLSDFQKMHHFE